MQRTSLFSALLVVTAIALACSGEESAPRAQTQMQKTPEQIAELEADCIKKADASSAEDLAAIEECLKKARE